ncbi:MAG: hypothetical protein ACYTBJ_12040 [Planctomycetota bacterium]|jgi:hypothetical protein
MRSKLTRLSSLAVLLALASTSLAKVHLAFDCGGCGPLQDGWIGITSCGTYTNVGGTNIDVAVDLVMADGECSCRSYLDKDFDGPATGPLAAVEQDFIFANDRRGSPDADIMITLSDLVPGARYSFSSYHNRLDESQTTIQAVQVAGAAEVTKPDTIDQEHNRIINPALISFTAGRGVNAFKNAYDVAPTNILDDDKVTTSRIIFETDGSEVLVIYRAGSNSYPDCGRKRREGSRGILNAFELNLVDAPR